MMLAYRILREAAPPEVRDRVRIPVSYFLASDMFYTFMDSNGLVGWSDQKYKPEAQMRLEYPQLVHDFIAGKFPVDILARLKSLLEQAGKQPLIVRSSSLLEDNFGTSFAGKYDSYFCPNQGDPQENLKALTEAIAQIYASCVNPDALLYRHQKGLVDYDERIAILLQFATCTAGHRRSAGRMALCAWSGDSVRAPWKPWVTIRPAWWRSAIPACTRQTPRMPSTFTRRSSWTCSTSRKMS
jgi:hypothetical protein